jgi:NNP family nitrate/nitrite transporter-like MFS transporter
MSDVFLFGILPYVAFAVFLVGTGWRHYAARRSVTTRSSQFLESRSLFWGSVSWHYAILLVLGAHLVAVLFPRQWGALLGDSSRLVVLEITGLGLGLLALAAVVLLVVRRVASGRVLAVTTRMDWVVLALLVAQVGTGVWVALNLRWGSVWYLHTAVPWLHSLVRLDPKVEYAALLPGVVKVHALLALALIAAVPFSRLVHALSIPLSYLWRPYQLVVWNAAGGGGAGAGALAGGPAPVAVPGRPARSGAVLTVWNPEDQAFWASTGKAVATRNLWISIPALLLAFAVWMVWSVVVVRLPEVGFRFTTDQLFWLAALPGLTGATLRIFYSFMVPIFGGRRFTAFSTASLLVPALGIGFAVQDPTTSYGTMLVLALLCGFGGANFASSMANISFFYPKKEKGTALGLNAGLGNLGVSVMQFVVPLVITAGVFGGMGGAPQASAKAGGGLIWLQNAGFIWVPFVLASTVAAWFGMNDIASAKASFRDQAVIFRRKHNWIMCWLYVGTFGSFIGYSAAFPLLIKSQFAGVDPMKYAFLGPLVGALLRPVGGWLSDKIGGARVTLWNFLVMAGAAAGVIAFLPSGGDGGSFAGFLAMFLVLFATSGVGNGSTFRMIPVIFATFHERRTAGGGQAGREQALRDGAKEAAAVIGFSSAVAAYGAFFIPRAFGVSMKSTGSPAAAIVGFIVVYASCIALTWWYYARRKAEMPS